MVVLKTDTQADENEIIAFAKDKIAKHRVPKRLHFIEDLPRNTAGKILKRELRDTYS